MSYVDIDGLIGLHIEGRFETCGWPCPYLRCALTGITLTGNESEWVDGEYFAQVASFLASLSNRSFADFRNALEVGTRLCNRLEDDREWDAGEAWSNELDALGDWINSREAPISIERALQKWDEQTAPYRARLATKRAKRAATAARRGQFQAARPQLVLQLIERGDPYICSSVGCHRTDDLTIDHKVPLSRGGADDLSNLQFLCRPCNSRKRDSLTALAEMERERA